MYLVQAKILLALHPELRDIAGVCYDVLQRYSEKKEIRALLDAYLPKGYRKLSPIGVNVVELLKTTRIPIAFLQ